MGIAVNNLAASDDESLLGARLRADCDQAGVQKTIVPRRPVLLLLMPDPVDAWTRTNAATRLIPNRRSFSDKLSLTWRLAARLSQQIKGCGLVILLTIALSVGASHSRGLARLGGSFGAHRSRSVDQSLKSLFCPHVCITIAHEPTTRMVA
jgi:hypothetical protein